MVVRQRERLVSLEAREVVQHWLGAPHELAGHKMAFEPEISVVEVVVHRLLLVLVVELDFGSP